MEEKRVSSIMLSCKELPYSHLPKHKKHVPDKFYKRIMKLFFKKVVYYMIKDGARFVMPHRLGALQIVRYPFDKNHKDLKEKGVKPRVMVDFNATKKLKAQGIDKTVKLNCKTTGGYWWRLHWYKANSATFRTQRLYSAEFTRPNVRPNSYNLQNPKLSVIPYFRDKGWEIYVEFDNKNSK